VAGLEVASRVFALVDPSVRVDWKARDGDRVQRGAHVGVITGPARAVLTGERLALNLLQRMSGIATATRRMVDAVGPHPAQILDTRKTVPGLRYLDKWAVVLGGGTNHRFGLFDMILIKDNHIAAGRSRGLTLGQVIGLARAGVPHTLRIEVEVMSFEEAQEAVEAHADVILLDNMTPTEMKRCVAMIAGRALTEASGGVTVSNAREIAESGVDIISSGSLTHSARALDISLNVETVN